MVDLTPEMICLLVSDEASLALDALKVLIEANSHALLALDDTGRPPIALALTPTTTSTTRSLGVVTSNTSTTLTIAVLLFGVLILAPNSNSTANPIICSTTTFALVLQRANARHYG
jgi:hypothetical protein